MQVVFHEDFHQVYTSDPAAAEGRMKAVIDVLGDDVDYVEAKPASEEDIAAVHTKEHMDRVRRRGLYAVSALAAGGAVQAATIGLTEPSFALIRPPGHHASTDSCWGFCYFNNMAVALESLKRKGRIKSAFVLDFDLHYGDGTVNILGNKGYVRILNPAERDRKAYMEEVDRELEECRFDIIGISAGFDYHWLDWGGLLETEDYYEIGKRVSETAAIIRAGCFALLEGGYNQDVLGYNVQALIRGMSEPV